MKLLHNIKKFTVAVFSVAVLLGAANPGLVQARTQYQDNGTSTTATPVFNEFYDVPNAVGDEADFVRLRPQGSTDNAAYVSVLNAACNEGDAFTVRTYVHNGADPAQNNNGAGTAVAHGVKVAMVAPIGATQSSFTFTSTISATNAATVSDLGKLNCNNNKTVKLTLVPGTVKTYSQPIGYNTEADSAINGLLPIGSQVHASGDQWGCWQDRIIVTYDVKVTAVTTPPVEKPKPKTLPKTGSGSVAAIVVATTAISTLAYAYAGRKHSA